MPPKKRERDNDNSKNIMTDQYKADHELFLNAFEKPTQIYRYLRLRNSFTPIFLHRTLTYMTHRMSRSHKTRKGFKVNTLLEKLKEKQESKLEFGEHRYMTLTFLGFYDRSVTTCPKPVKVETSLMKISHKKRKDSSSPLVKLFIGTSEVPMNPSSEHPPPLSPVISIPAESFNSTNGNVIKSYVLFLRVTRIDLQSDSTAYTENDLEIEQITKRPKTEDCKFYGSELTVYDKQHRCLLAEGDYEVAMHELQNNTKTSPKKNNQWVTMENTQDKAFELFKKGPHIRFKLEWCKDAGSAWVNRPAAITTQQQQAIENSNKENRPDKTQSTNNNTTLAADGQHKIAERFQIVYQFLYNNNSRQQTEACDDFICPWCSLNCNTLYSLLKHLKLCHSRFTFTYNQIPEGARIDVAINECFDGSYTGSPHDLISQPPGFAFSRNGPVRRTCITNILVCRPKRPRPSLSEFLEQEENDFEGQRPYITGHNRLYHHTTTCLPVYPKEMDVDSEGENDPKWLQQKAIMMIDDFTDVNEGEKELMKLWNLHVMKHGYVGDCQIPLACLMFLKARGDDLLKKNLYRNFILHVCNLFDFGLLSSSTLYTIVRQLHESIKHNSEAGAAIRDTYQVQTDNWIKSGGEGGSQDKTGTPFVFYNQKPDITNKMATSSSTFITGDGTLRRKMTQQQQQQPQQTKKQTSERRNSKNAVNTRKSPDKEECNKKFNVVNCGYNSNTSDSNSSEVVLRKKNNMMLKRKLSLQNTDKQVVDAPVRRKSATTSSTSTNNLLQFRRKSTTATNDTIS